MIEDSTIWYLGSVTGGSYKLAKYTDTNMSGYAKSTESKVGLLRLGELMSGQFDRYQNNADYWTLTPSDSKYTQTVIYMQTYGEAGYGSLKENNQYDAGVRPSLNLKSNVTITSGDGTKNNPFTLSGN